jgi:hypothetical protein
MLSVNAFPLADGADVRARKTSRNHVNKAPPYSSVEGTNIVPNGERWQMPLILPLQESSGAKGIDFHGANGLPAQKDSAEDSSSSSGEEGKFSHSSTNFREKCQLISGLQFFHFDTSLALPQTAPI